MPRRILKPIICALAALIAWSVLPGTMIDRGLFSLTARTFAEAPFFTSGNGIPESPHTLLTLKREAATPANPIPDIAITDDPDRVFQSSPPSPVDFAIILKNLRRLGRESIAIGMPLTWDKPDAISLIALDQQLDSVPSVVTSAPLARSPVPSPIPPAFRRASVAISSILGNARNLPLVNRVSIPDVILGNKTSLAGFTTLESEPEGGLPHLLARWDDRVVFSVPLLAALADHKVLPENVEIRLGHYISLGKDGPTIPIDGFGRLAFEPPASDGSASISAETLIDAPDNLLAEQRPGTVLIRNGMSVMDDATLRFSQTLVPTASLLADPSGTSTERVFHRIPRMAELLLIASLICLLHGLGNFPKTNGRSALMVLAGVFAILHFILVPGTSTWLPTLPALVAILTAIPLTERRKIVSVAPAIPTSKPAPAYQPEFQLEIETAKAPVPKAKPATKAPVKKAAKAAPKKPAKKAPSKKSPKKRKGR